MKGFLCSLLHDVPADLPVYGFGDPDGAVLPQKGTWLSSDLRPAEAFGSADALG